MRAKYSHKGLEQIVFFWKKLKKSSIPSLAARYNLILGVSSSPHSLGWKSMMHTKIIEIQTSNVNDIVTKLNEASILEIFISKWSKPGLVPELMK